MTVKKRQYLFLQGPFGPFFRRLGKQLFRMGHDVTRVNFNGGDQADWSNSASLNYKHPIDQWQDWLRSLLADRSITDVILYGDTRPYHKIAIALCRQLNINIHVLEEGYLRPNWVTLESNGVNGYSNIATEFAETDVSIYKKHPSTSKSCGRITRGQILLCLRHYAFLILYRPLYLHFKSHRSLPIRKEIYAWLKWIPKKKAAHKQADAIIKSIIERKQGFFLIPLQLQSDAQVKHHSQFKHIRDFLKEVVESFALNASADDILLIKNHPLDNHVQNYKKLVYRLGAKHRLSKRIKFIDGGHLPTLLNHVKGVVTINSTVGMQALHHQCPVKTLGHAIYNLESLTDKKPLTEFWQKPQKPNRNTYQNFYQFLIHHCQFNGSFYTPRGRKYLLEDQEVLRRLNAFSAEVVHIHTQQDKPLPKTSSISARI